MKEKMVYSVGWGWIVAVFVQAVLPLPLILSFLQDKNLSVFIKNKSCSGIFGGIKFKFE